MEQEVITMNVKNTNIINLLENILTELEAQQNLLRLAEEEAENIGVKLDPTNERDCLNALGYANRADIMLTLLYVSTDKARSMHEWAQNALADCLTGKAE